MARRKGRSVGDVTRYTGTARSNPARFPGNDSDDDSVTSGTTFFLIALVVFLALMFAGVRYGTAAIENDLETRAEAALLNEGFTEVEVIASGTTLTVQGQYPEGELDPEAAYRAVRSVSGVGDVEGQIFAVSVGELGDARVTGSILEATWQYGIVTLTGALSSEEKIEFVEATLTDSADTPFVSVVMDDVTVKEGLLDDAWLGPSLGLLQTVARDLPTGFLKVDGDAKLVAVSGEVEEKDLRNLLNDAVLETAAVLGFSPTPGVLLLDTAPTEEEVEELQEDLNELVLDQVVEFEVKSFALTDQGKRVLDEVIDALEAAPETIRVLISGHTDNRGGTEENQLLSEQRATAVLDYLVARGQDPERFDTVGFGETQPIETNDTAAGRARNRRIEFTALFVVIETEDGA